MIEVSPVSADSGVFPALDAVFEAESVQCRHRPDLVTWHCQRCGVPVQMSDDERAEYAVARCREESRPMRARLDGEVVGTLFPSGLFVPDKRRRRNSHRKTS